jgi:membrane protein DedA with SNARE-associated domain
MTKLLIITKFIPATNLMIIALIGWSKTKFGIFFKSYLKSVLLWFGSMAVLAYFLMSGLHYLRSSKIFKRVEIAILVIFVIIFAGEHVLSKILKKYAAVEEKAEVIGEAIEEKFEETEKENPH